MAKLLLHGSNARHALAKGVAQLAASVEPTLGPKGLNAMVDRPIGTPIVTRDGVSIAGEIELSDRFENMGAQVVREVSMQTNEVAGDGTTTAMVLANSLIQRGVSITDGSVRPVDLCKGIDIAVKIIVDELGKTARRCDDNPEYLTAVATVAATDPELGALVAEAFHRVGKEGVINADYSVTVETTLNVVEGMSFDRGYLSHHMVTDEEKMEAVLENPLILMTDQKILNPDDLYQAREVAHKAGRPLLIIAEEIAPSVVVTLMDNGGAGKYLIVHPPEYGHWRTAMMDDIAILTGGEVIARDLGKKSKTYHSSNWVGLTKSLPAPHLPALSEDAVMVPLSRQDERKFNASMTQHPNIDQDKLRERLSKLSGGMAVISVGGFTPVEQKRKIQLIEDSLCAVQAAAEDGVVAGGGTALAQIGHTLDEVIATSDGDVRAGIELLRSVLTRPVERIAFNAGANPDTVREDVMAAASGHGYDASTGGYCDMFATGIIDPVRVTTSALVNAASVATLILTTETLIADLAEGEADPTAGPALGGGAELLGRP